jgi:hypothetical protein
LTLKSIPSVFMYAMNIQNDVIGLVLRENCKSKQVIDFIAWPSRCHGRIHPRGKRFIVLECSHYFHKNHNINSYLNPHPPSWDVRNDHIDASDITLLHNYGFEIRLNIKTGINAYVCFRMKTVMKSPYSLHSKTIKRLPLGCILPWHTPPFSLPCK